MARIQDTLIDVVQILRENLDRAIDDLASTPGDYVVLSNIAFNEAVSGRTPNIQDKVVITLIKTEEETTLKNQPNYQRHPVSGVLEYNNPPVFLNVYLLITANYNDYLNAITQLSRVIGYFQYKSTFSNADTELVIPAGSPISQFSFNMSMVSLAFEQLNHIWSVLGGKHLPSVLYKMQLVKLVYVPDEVEAAPIIEAIEMQEKIY